MHWSQLIACICLTIGLGNCCGPTGNVQDLDQCHRQCIVSRPAPVRGSGIGLLWAVPDVCPQFTGYLDCIAACASTTGAQPLLSPDEQINKFVCGAAANVYSTVRPCIEAIETAAALSCDRRCGTLKALQEQSLTFSKLIEQSTSSGTAPTAAELQEYGTYLCDFYTCHLQCRAGLAVTACGAAGGGTRNDADRFLQTIADNLITTVQQDHFTPNGVALPAVCNTFVG